MSEPATETLSVIVEREIAFPPEKVWRALTQPHLIEEWLMKNDFKPAVGHRFSLRADPQPAGTASSTARSLSSSRTKRCLIRGAPARPTSPSRASLRCLSHPRAQARFCAWSRPASGRIRSKIIKAQNLGGNISSANWSRSWRGQIDACRLALRLVFRGGVIEPQQLYSASPPLAVHYLYSGRHRQLRRYGARETSLLGGLLATAAALLAIVHRSVLVRATLCRQVA